MDTVYDVTEPDVRFLLANERTFLAWSRTALALVAARLAIVQLLRPFPGVPWGRHLLGVLLIVAGAVVAVAGHRELERNRRALYHDEPLPPSSVPRLLAVAITAIALAARGRPHHLRRTRRLTMAPRDKRAPDPGLAGERTELAWRRTMIAFTALTGALVKANVSLGLPTLTLSALVGVVAHRCIHRTIADLGDRRFLLTTGGILAISLVTLAAILLGGCSRR